MHSNTAAFAGIALSIMLFSNAQAQHVHIQTNGSTTSALAVIDGAAHPELISDQEAITVFWITIMEPPTAGDGEKNRFSAKTGDMQLSEQGNALLWAAAKDFHIQFMPLRQQAQQLASAADSSHIAFAASPALQRRAAVGASIDKLAMDAYNNLLATLPPTEAASLKSHIAVMKKQIKVVPPPHM